MNQKTTGYLGIVGLLALGISGPVVHRGPIEAFVKARAEAALLQAGLGTQPDASGWQVAPEGLDIQLTGPLEEAVRARQIVQFKLATCIPWSFDVALRPPRLETAPAPTPSPQPAPEASPEPARLGQRTGQVQVFRDGTHTYLRGIYPDTASQQRALAAARAAFGSGVADETSLRSDISALGWPEQLLSRLPLLRKVEGLALFAGGDAFTVSGTVATAAERDTLVAALQGLLPDRVTLENFLVLPNQIVLEPEPESDPLPDTVRQQAQAQLDRAVGAGQVLFATGSSRLSPEAFSYLDQVADAIQGQDEGAITIGGHTDSEGRVQDNLYLSQKRADAVRAYLIRRGLPARRLFSRGYGSEQPRDSNATAPGRRRNRRISVTIH